MLFTKEDKRSLILGAATYVLAVFVLFPLAALKTDLPFWALTLIGAFALISFIFTLKFFAPGVMVALVFTGQSMLAAFIAFSVDASRASVMWATVVLMALILIASVFAVCKEEKEYG